MTWKPRVRTVLLCVNLSILILPLAGIGILRIYENALLQQTESELTAQAAFVAAAYKTSLLRNFQQSKKPQILESYGIKQSAIKNSDVKQWDPKVPKLDLASDEILPPPPDPVLVTAAITSEVRDAGEEITQIMLDAQQTTLAAIRVVDVNGIVIATTGEGLHQSLANREEVRKALTGEYQSILRQRVSDNPIPPFASISRGARIRVFQAMPVLYQDYVLGAVVLSRTPPNVGQSLYRYRSELIIAALILILMVLAISAITALTLTRPIEAVTRQAEQVARGKSDSVVPLQQPVTNEVSQLSNAVLQMAEHLEARAQYIQDFASQISHAFKTPLTAMRGAIELLQDHQYDMSDDDKNRFLNNLDEDTEYLQNLVQRLLELARADTIRPGNDRTLVTPVIELVAQRSRRLGLDVNIETHSNDKAALISTEILQSIFENLFDNARQHGADQINVSLEYATDAASLKPVCVITIADNGSGISIANQEFIFQPFFTTARGQGGSGLGLAVTSSLLNA
ncbi:MAG: HAMP domain-containing histidine kinase, partial [Gammaproteobacteria bacterium]|nr:HAMP domain-containing histidine kinase [Gammaproteobacteria bacterium]